MRLFILFLLAALTACDDSQPTPQPWELDEKGEVFYPEEMADPTLTIDYMDSNYGGSFISIAIDSWYASIFSSEMTQAEKGVFNVMYQHQEAETFWVTIDEQIFGHPMAFECSLNGLHWRLPDGTLAMCDRRQLLFAFSDRDDPRGHHHYTTNGFRVRLGHARDALGVEVVFGAEARFGIRRLITM